MGHSTVNAPEYFTAASTIDAATHTIVTDEVQLAELLQGETGSPIDEAITETIGQRNLEVFHRESEKYEKDTLLSWNELIEGITFYNIYRQLLETRIMAVRAIELSILTGSSLNDADMVMTPPQHIVAVDDQIVRSNPFPDYKTLDISRLKQAADHALRQGESIGDAVSYVKAQTLMNIGGCTIGLAFHTGQWNYRSVPHELKDRIRQRRLATTTREEEERLSLDSSIVIHSYPRQSTNGSQVRQKAAADALQFMVEQRSQESSVVLPTSPAGAYVYRPSHTSLYDDIRSRILTTRGGVAAARKNPRSGNPAKRNGTYVTPAPVKPQTPRVSPLGNPAPKTVAEQLPYPEEPSTEQVFPAPPNAILRAIGLAGRDSLRYRMTKMPPEFDDALSIDGIVQVYARLWKFVDAAADAGNDLAFTELRAKFDEVCAALPEILPSVEWLRQNWSYFMQVAEASAHCAANAAQRDRVARLIDACTEEANDTSDGVRVSTAVIENELLQPSKLPPMRENTEATKTDQVRPVGDRMYHMRTGETDTTIPMYLEKEFRERPTREALQTVIGMIGDILETENAGGIKKVKHFRNSGQTVYELKPSEVRGLGKKVKVGLITGFRVLFTIDKACNGQKGTVRIISVIDRGRFDRVLRGLG